MLEIAKELKRLRANIRITCIGKGAGRARLESKLRKEGLEDYLILKGVSGCREKSCVDPMSYCQLRDGGNGRLRFSRGHVRRLWPSSRAM